MKKILIFSSIFVLVAVFTLAQIAVAQDFGSALSATNDVSVEFNPPAPGSNQSVTATVSSYSVDLNSAGIAWLVNGKVQKNSTGLTSFSFTTGPIGKTTTIGVIIATTDGQVIKKTFSLKSAEVDLIWQAESYTPPFYQGKALFSHEERLEFVAIPHIIGSNGAEIPASQLTYKWTKNGTVVGDFSGYGKNTYTMIGSIISVPIDMQVEVSATDGTGIADAEVIASPVNPSIIFYQRDPLYGIQFQNALPTSFALTTKEIDILAVPFFFGGDDVGTSNLQYSWSINGSQIDNNLSRTDRVFRPANGTSGTSNISLSITNTNKILQMVDSGFNLTFNAPK
jgi:hypothetical protein